MGCIETIKLPIPTLGGGLSIALPPLPAVDASIKFCCFIFKLPAVPPPAAFGVALPPGLMTVITAQIKLVQAYIDALPPQCPAE